MSLAAENDQSDLVGRVVLGRYRIVRAIARGGMGIIYLARMEGAADFVKPVVVKRMLSEHADESALKMFKREARIMSMLRHPGIVSVTDFGKENADFLLVMDYVHGFHLGRWASYVQQSLARNGVAGQLPWQLTTHIIIQVLDALEYAHTLRGTDGQPLHVVHRDVSPSNVLLDIEGRVLLADFGIAKSAGEEETKTVVGTVKGKFSYMAPEILEGYPPEPSGDVYASAVVLHEILVGRNEFRAGEPAITIQRVLNHVPRRLDVVRPDIPAALADVVARALDKDVKVRFKTAGEFAKALRRVRGMDGEEANDALRKTLDRDFRDPRFAAMFELPELDSLEQSWRTSPDAEPISVPPMEASGMRNSAEPTRFDKTNVAPAPLPAPAPVPVIVEPASNRGLFIAMFVLAAIAVAGAFGIAIWAITRETEASQPIIYLNEEHLDAALGTPDAGFGEPDAFVEPDAFTATRERNTPRTPEDPTVVINRVFGRNIPQFQACFANATGEFPTVSVHFTTDTRGRVTNADVRPGDIAGSPAGQCLAREARSLDFTPSVGAQRFSIPLTVRR
jgi:serine/threonine-protein kinase